MRTQIAVTLRVSGDGIVQAMLTAIDLHDEIVLLAIEIRGVGADRRSPAKLQAIELPVTQALPHLALSEARITAEPSSAPKRTNTPGVCDIACDDGGGRRRSR
ncbi:MAG TPA: hypothetical protein VIF14_12600 [Alphaproteobacteria bacterium]|jgi:hypothetical protein